jgi:Uri superfamily endonuclease
VSIVAPVAGAYLLRMKVCKPIRLRVGALGQVCFPPGEYLYVGSARKGIRARVERHKRLASTKRGALHWHIDYLLVHEAVQLRRAQAFPGGSECVLAKKLASQKGAAIPVRGFGSSDCNSGCPAHLFQSKGR